MPTQAKMASLSKEHIGCQEIYILQSKTGKIISLIPDLGCSLFNLTINNQPIVKTWKSKDLKADLTKRFPGTQLFPFPNRLKNGQFLVDNQTFRFPTNLAKPHALHGHLYNYKSQFKSFNPNLGKLTFELNYTGDDPAYPFPYKITNAYILADEQLAIWSKIKNLSDHEIPIAHGWHPYFKVDFDLDSITIPASQKLEVDDTLIPTGDMLPFSDYEKPIKLSNLTLDNCFKLDSNARQIALHYGSTGQTLKLHTGSYDFVQIYTTPERDAIAIEPQSAAPDAFNNGIGCTYLKPNEEINHHFTILMESHA